MRVYIGRYLDFNKETQTQPERYISVELDPFDTWSMDHTLSYIIHPMLIQLKATKHGSPFIDDEDVPEALRSTSAGPKKDEWDIDDNWHKRWEWVIDEMIWAFAAHADENAEDAFITGESDIWWQPCDAEGNNIGPAVPTSEKTQDGSFYKMVDGPKSTFKVDRDGLTAFQARKENAFRLFGKYFTALWD